MTTDDLLEIHLVADRCSKKGVRVRTLSPSDLDAVLRSAAKQAGRDAEMVDLLRSETTLGVEAMIVAITRSPVSSLPDPSASWEPYDPSKRQLATKDFEILRRVYAKLHAVSNDEVDAIMGKAQTVSAG